MRFGLIITMMSNLYEGSHGFWKIYFHHLHNGVLLQQITNRLDAGKMLEKIIHPVVWNSYKYQTYPILKESVIMLRKCFIKLKQDPQSFENLLDISSAAQIYKFPTNLFFLRFIIKLIINKTGFHFNEIFYTEFWKLRLITQPMDAMNTLKSNIPYIKWVSSINKSSYLADPFVY